MSESPRSVAGWANPGWLVGAMVGLIAVELNLFSLVSYWGDRALWVPIIAVSGSLLWLTRLRPALIAGAVLFAALWLTVVFTPLTKWLARDLVRRDALVDADAIYVLASSIQRDGDLTSSAMSRLLHGFELLASEKAPRLILADLAEPSPSYEPTARRMMASLRIDGELIVLGPVRRTRDEAVAVAALFRERSFERLILVTSPTHSRRASASFEREGLTVLSSPSRETKWDLETLRKHDDRVAGFGSVVHERVGLLFYRMRGWI